MQVSQSSRPTLSQDQLQPEMKHGMFLPISSQSLYYDSNYFRLLTSLTIYRTSFLQASFSCQRFHERPVRGELVILITIILLYFFFSVT